MIRKYRIFGSSLTSIVIVDYLSKQINCEVEWILTNKNRYGGHFAGVEVFNSQLDIGMVALEVDEPIKQKDSITTTSPPQGNQINSFLKLVNKWFMLQGVTIHQMTIETKHNDRNYPDIFISNDTTLFYFNKHKLNLDENHLDKHYYSTHHPIRKNEDNFVKYLNLERYIRQVYGDSFFTEIVFQFVNKIDIKLLEKVIVACHRSLWIPLYYPETILASTRNINENTRLVRFFSCIKQDTIAELLKRIINSIRSSDRVKVIENLGDFSRDTLIDFSKKNDGTWINVFAEDQKLISKQTVSNTEYLGIFVIYIKTKTELTDRVIFDTDLSNDFFRLTSRSVKDKLGFNYVSIESTKDFKESLEANFDYSYFKDYAHSVLGVNIEIEEICVKSGKLNLMTKEYVLDIEKKSEETSNFLQKYNVIDLSHNGLNNSMNEQILSALWYIEKINDKEIG